MTLIFAGSSFIFGLDEIRDACRKRGWDALFVEAPFIKRYGFMQDTAGQSCDDVHVSAGADVQLPAGGRVSADVQQGAAGYVSAAADGQLPAAAAVAANQPRCAGRVSAAADGQPSAEGRVSAGADGQPGAAGYVPGAADVHLPAAPSAPDVLYSDDFNEILAAARHVSKCTVLASQIPDGGSGLQDESYILIPLSEYWISRSQELCAEAESRGAGRVSAGAAEHPCDAGCVSGPGYTALHASRSKSFLYETLSAAGITVPATYQDLQTARNAIESGHRVVVKPDGLFSGYGVEIVGPANAGDLELHVKKAAGLKNNATKLFQVQSSEVLLSEHVAGIEYSADCFIADGKVTVVRICRKHLTVINDKPCTLAVEYIPVPDAHRGELIRWCYALFGAKDMSFAQFDYIERKGQLIPIDFACRVGGGMKTLLKSTSTCCYAAAIAGTTLQPLDDDNRHPVLYNFLTTTSGYLLTDVTTLPVAQDVSSISPSTMVPYSISPTSAPDCSPSPAPRLTIYKHPGDYVTSNPSSAASRLGDLVSWTSEPPAADYLSQLVLGAEHVRRGKK